MYLVLLIFQHYLLEKKIWDFCELLFLPLLEVNGFKNADALMQ